MAQKNLTLFSTYLLQMWWSRRPSFRFPSRLFILGHTKFGMPGSRAWSDRRMGRGPFSPGLCCTSLCSTRACHYHHGPDWSTWIGFLETLWVRNLSLIWYFIGFAQDKKCRRCLDYLFFGKRTSIAHDFLSEKKSYSNWSQRYTIFITK